MKALPSCLLFFFAVLGSTELRAETIAQMCSLENDNVTPELSYSEVKDILCAQALESGASEAMELAADTLEILGRMAPASLSPVQKSSYRDSLDAFAQFLNQSRTTLPQITVQDALGRKLDSLLTNFSDPGKRQDAQGYYDAIKAVMAESEAGRRALDCFYNNESSRVDGYKIQFEDTGVDLFVGSLGLERSETDPTKYKNVMTMNLSQLDPISAYSVVSHEMVHACDAKYFIPHHDRMRELEAQKDGIRSALYSRLGPLPAFSELVGGTEGGFHVWNYVREGDDESRATIARLFSAGDLAAIENTRAQILSIDAQIAGARGERQRESALSELRAYKLASVDMFKEIARYDRSYFCNQRVFASWFDIATTYGQSRSNYEQLILSNQFIERLVEKYTETGYRPELFYRQNADGERVLAPEFQQKINAVRQELGL